MGNMAFRDFGSTELCEHEVLAAGQGEKIKEQYPSVTEKSSWILQINVYSLILYPIDSFRF